MQHSQFRTAIAFHQEGNLVEAERIYRQILRVSPHHAPSLNQLGILAAQTGNYKVSERLFNEAIRVSPSPVYHFNLARTLDSQGKPGAARQYWKAIKLNPAYAEAYNNLGNFYRRTGEIQRAIASYRKAVSIKPGLAEAHHQLALCKTFATKDEDVLAMETLLRERDLDDAQKVHLCFGLGKAYEDLGEYQVSFDYYHMANRRHRNTIQFDIALVEKKFSCIMEVFTTSLFEHFSSAGCDDATPVFIVGMPRSGTTLFEQMLTGHSRIHGAGELYDLHQLAGKTLSDDSVLYYPENIQALQREGLEEMGEAYLQRLRRHSSSARRIVDKMPQNFFYLGLIRLILPRATIIHCTRHPVATCFSCFKQHFSSPHQYAYDLAELGRYYACYERLMEHWKTVLPGFIHEVKYEDLIGDPERELRHALEFCGIPWDDGCLAFYKTGNIVKTASSVQVRQPLYSSSLEQWRNFSDNLTPLIDSLPGVEKS